MRPRVDIAPDQQRKMPGGQLGIFDLQQPGLGQLPQVAGQVLADP
jgi:hypothetical protein